MQDESISTINVYDLERAARRQAYEECADIANSIATQFGNRWISEGRDKKTYDGGRIAGWSDGAADASKAIRAKLETMP